MGTLFSSSILFENSFNQNINSILAVDILGDVCCLNSAFCIFYLCKMRVLYFNDQDKDKLNFKVFRKSLNPLVVPWTVINQLIQKERCTGPRTNIPESRASKEWLCHLLEPLAAGGEAQRGEQVSQIPVRGCEIKGWRNEADGKKRVVVASITPKMPHEVLPWVWEPYLSCPTQSFEGAPKEGVSVTKLLSKICGD